MSTIPATPSPATVPPVTKDPAPPAAGRPRRGLNANSRWFPYLLVSRWC